MSELPSTWVTARLGDLAESVKNGISTPPNDDSGHAVLRISSVRSTRIDITDIRYLKSLPNGADDCRVSPGDLLFTRYNGSPDLVGVCATVPLVGDGLLYPDKLIRVRLHREYVEPRFVMYAVSAGASLAFIKDHLRTTAGQVGISGRDIKEVPVPLTSLVEQQRIVAALDERLSELDASVASLERAERNLVRYRAAVLAAACSGKLVPTEADIARELVEAWDRAHPRRTPHGQHQGQVRGADPA